MASKDQFAQFKKMLAGILLCMLFCTFALPANAYAKDLPDSLPNLNTFIETVKDGNAATLRGVYIANVMAFPIVQQPQGNPGFVSTLDSVITQFSIAAEVGNLGLLAHNHLAGKSFTAIKQGDQIVLVYGDGHTEIFLVESIQQYQALSPLSPHSQFKELDAQSTLTAEELFQTVYRGAYHLTLQTCIKKDGNSSWGRLFIIANPLINKNFKQTAARSV